MIKWGLSNLQMKEVLSMTELIKYSQSKQNTSSLDDRISKKKRYMITNSVRKRKIWKLNPPQVLTANSTNECSTTKCWELFTNLKAVPILSAKLVT